jgi:hypothetical protein
MSTLLRSELQRSSGAHLEPSKAAAEHTAPRHSPLGSEASCGSYGLSSVPAYCAGSREAIESSAKEPATQDFHTGITWALLARELGQRSVTERWWHLHSAMSSFTRCWTQTSSRRTVSGARSTNNNAWYAANA